MLILSVLIDFIIVTTQRAQVIGTGHRAANNGRVIKQVCIYLFIPQQLTLISRI
jgi:hypothetical protein